MSDKALRTSKVENINGAPVLTVDGNTIPLMCFHWCLENDKKEKSKYKLSQMIKAGTKVFFTRMHLEDPANFDYHYNHFTEEMELLTSLNPDAYVIPWIYVMPYDGFAKKYPSDVVHFEDGSTNKWTANYMTMLSSDNGARYSFASENWKAEVGDMLDMFIKKLLASPYAKNIIGYFTFLMSQETSWHFHFNSLEDSIDHSPCMQEFFHKYLMEKYNNDEQKLQKAWKDNAVTFNTAKIPDRERRVTGDFGYFRNPSQSAQVYDYAECHSKAVSDKLLYFASVCKKACDNKHVFGVFYGYLMNQDFQWGGQGDIKAVLECPDIDFWASPFTYEKRSVGNFASLRMAIKTLNNHGKMFFAEADTFFNDSNKEELKKHKYSFYSDSDDVAVFERDYAYVFIEGCNGWWNDWSAGDKMYNELTPLVKTMADISKKGYELNRSPVSEVAGVIDQESLFAPACNSRHHGEKATETPPLKLMINSLHRSRIHELCRIGTPVDFYETADLVNEKTKQYRTYVFLNQYVADDKERETIESLKKDGNVLIFMYGSGLINPDKQNGLDIAYAEQLTGFKLGYDLSEQKCGMTALSNPLMPSVKGGEKLGDCNRNLNDDDNQPRYHGANKVNPLIFIEDEKAIPLATFDCNGKTGLAIKQFDNWTSVYVGSPYIQANVIRDMARLSGAHLFIDSEEVVFANQSFVAVHTSTSGTRKIKLTKPATVTEVFENRLVGENICEIVEDIPKHATRLYQLK